MTKKLEKSKVKISLKAIFIGLLFCFSYLSTFIHTEFDSLKSWETYASHKKKYKKITKDFNNEIKNIKADLSANGLNEYALKLTNAENNKKQSLKLYTKKKKELASEFAFLGYESKKVFMYDFGKTIILFAPLVLLLLILFNPHIIKELKKFLLFGVLGMLYVAFFWLFHNLFALTDFSKASYSFSYMTGAIFSTILTYFIFKFFSNVEKRRIKKEKELQDFLTNGTELVDLLKTTT